MSRLIDADELKTRMLEYYEDSWNLHKEIMDFFDNTPTIERKTGKWILTEDDDYEYCTCSECGYQNGENWMIGSDIPFCAMCGADMRGDDHETD